MKDKDNCTCNYVECCYANKQPSTLDFSNRNGEIKPET